VRITTEIAYSNVITPDDKNIRLFLFGHTDQEKKIIFLSFHLFRIVTEQFSLRESLVIRRVDLDNDTKSYIDNVEKCISNPFIFTSKSKVFN